MSQWVVVGVSGVTNGGKSTLTKKLLETLPGPVRLINQDDYFYPEDSQHHVPAPGGLMHHNWDVITSLDMERMAGDVMDIINSGIPEMSEILHRRESHYCPVLLLDGFLLYDHKRITDFCNLKYFLTLSHELCWERRKTRVYEPPDPPGYFDQCVWPMYESHLKRIKTMTGIVFLDGTEDPYQTVYQEILTLSKLPTLSSYTNCDKHIDNHVSVMMK